MKTAFRWVKAFFVQLHISFNEPVACAVLKPLEVLLVVDHMWVVGLNLFNLLDQLGGPAALDFVVL